MVDFSLAGKRVAIAGPRGMVGSALVRRLATVDCEVLPLGRAEADLTNQAQTFAWLEQHRPDALIVAAAEVGGILANSTRPATFLYDNLAIETNLIEGARRADVAKLLMLGSTCIYPKLAPQPMPEASLLTGPLEPTNEWYAIAKIAGVKLCDAYRRQYGLNFISAMPTNLYGPFDNFDLQSSHVMPALIAKAHHAKLTRAETLPLWGTGTPRREFLHVDDLADACVFLMEHYAEEGPINVGVGTDVTINELAALVARTVGWQGRFVNELDKPDGTPRKLVDVTKLTALGWRATIGLEDGVRSAYQWYCDNVEGPAAMPALTSSAVRGNAMTTSRLTVALLLTALPLVFAGPVQAQSDDTSDDTDQHEVARPGAPKPLVDQTNHHHGNGGDDGAARPSLRPDPADVPGVREGQPTFTGLAQTQAPLPGELADTPEARAPLFAKSPSDLAIRPDPWETPDK